MTLFSLFRKLNRRPIDLSSISVDMHSHLIPNIDDGVKTLEESIAVIRILKNLGIEKIITTPHIYKEYYPNTKAIILRGLEEVKEALKEAQISIQIEASAEYFMDDHFEKLLAKDEILPLNGKYLLIEMSFYGAPAKLFSYINQIQQKGYIPILAHPERYLFYEDNFSSYEKIKEAGCLFQMNLLSLEGYYNKYVKNMAQKLIDHHLIDFMGTDLHSQSQINAIQDLGLSSKTLSIIQNYPFKNRFNLI